MCVVDRKTREKLVPCDSEVTVHVAHFVSRSFAKQRNASVYFLLQWVFYYIVSSLNRN